MKPPETANCFATSASRNVRVKYVAETCAALLNSPISKPPSSSVVTSGLRSLLPRFDGTRPEPVDALIGAYVVNLSNAPG